MNDSVGIIGGVNQLMHLCLVETKEQKLAH
jgi:hypothetical protein